MFTPLRHCPQIVRFRHFLCGLGTYLDRIKPPPIISITLFDLFKGFLAGVWLTELKMYAFLYLFISRKEIENPRSPEMGKLFAVPDAPKNEITQRHVIRSNSSVFFPP